MKFKMQILVENDDGYEILLAENIEFERGKSSLENLGLSLAESKELLRKTQQTMVQEQVREFLKQSAICPHCQKKTIKQRQAQNCLSNAFRQNGTRQSTTFLLPL